jgi:hypothetical protein
MVLTDHPSKSHAWHCENHIILCPHRLGWEDGTLAGKSEARGSGLPGSLKISSSCIVPSAIPSWDTSLTGYWMECLLAQLWGLLSHWLVSNSVFLTAPGQKKKKKKKIPKETFYPFSEKSTSHFDSHLLCISSFVLHTEHCLTHTSMHSCKSGWVPPWWAKKKSRRN